MGTLNLHYDYNLNPMDMGFNQIHTMFSYGRYGDKEAYDIQCFRLVSIYRLVFTRGFYIGIGGGATTGTFLYSDRGDRRILNDPNAIKRTFRISLLHADADIGWQGKKRYYFSLGFQQGATIAFQSNVDVTAWPEGTSDRSAVRRAEKYFRDASLAYFAFGWFFN